MTDTMCFGWGWYLSHDFQMFILSVIVLAVYEWINRKAGKALAIMLILVNIGVHVGMNLNWGAGLYFYNQE